MRKDRRAAWTEMHVVFDAHSSPVRPVYPRFDCHHRAFGECPVSCLREARSLMHFEPQAMAKAVTEQIPKTALLNVVAGESVGITIGTSPTAPLARSVICYYHYIN